MSPPPTPSLVTPLPPGEKGLIGVGISSHICQIFKAVTHCEQREREREEEEEKGKELVVRSMKWQAEGRGGGGGKSHEIMKEKEERC